MSCVIISIFCFKCLICPVKNIGLSLVPQHSLSQDCNIDGLVQERRNSIANALELGLRLYSFLHWPINMCSTHWASMHGRNDIHWTVRQHTFAHIGALIRYPRNELSGNRCSTYVHIIVYIVTGNTSTNYFVLFFGLYTHVYPAMWDGMEHGLYVPCPN